MFLFAWGMCYNESVAFISSINQLSKNKGEPKMQYSKEVEDMICVAKGPNHGPAPIPEEGKLPTAWAGARLSRAPAS